MIKVRIEMLTKVGQYHKHTSIPNFWVEYVDFEAAARAARMIVDPDRKSRVSMGLADGNGHYWSALFEAESGEE